MKAAVHKHLRMLCVIVLLFYSQPAEANTTGDLYKSCKNSEPICSFYFGGLREGYLLGYSGGIADGGGKLAGKYVGLASLSNEAALALLELGRIEGRAQIIRLMKCYAAISVENLATKFILTIDKNPKLASGDLASVSKSVLDALVRPCISEVDGPELLDSVDLPAEKERSGEFVTDPALPIRKQNEIHKTGFSLTLPSGWVEVPQEVLESNMHENLKQLTPGARIPKYDYGFQREAVTNGLKYPYILVQVLSTGRIPESQLKSMQKVDLKKVLHDMSYDLPAVISNATAGQLFYDESAHIVWGTLQSDVNDVGKIQTLIGMIPTQKGYVTMYAYSEEKSFKSFVPLFRAIISSTTIEPELSYKTQLSDSSPVERVIYKGIVGGFAGGIIVLLFSFFRKTIKGVRSKGSE